MVDKPAGATSHDVVAQLRRRLGERRMGHSGTLDPDATGVLLVGVGSLTRALRFLTDLPKTYTGEVVLGVETSTLDASGEVTARHDMGGITIDAVRAAVAEHLTGTVVQVPPMVSARRVGGRRLHELAREGVEVEREARPVTVHRFDVRPDAGPARLPHRGPVLVGDVHPDARRGSRAPARRRRAPAGPAPHGHRLVHRGRGRSP